MTDTPAINAAMTFSAAASLASVDAMALAATSLVAAMTAMAAFSLAASLASVAAMAAFAASWLVFVIVAASD